MGASFLSWETTIFFSSFYFFDILEHYEKYFLNIWVRNKKKKFEGKKSKKKCFHNEGKLCQRGGIRWFSFKLHLLFYANLERALNCWMVEIIKNQKICQWNNLVLDLFGFCKIPKFSIITFKTKLNDFQKINFF